MTHIEDRLRSPGLVLPQPELPFDIPVEIEA